MNKTLDIIEKAKKWGSESDDIRALLLIGSLAGQNKSDDLSDYDISVFCTSSQKFLEDDQWLANFGEVAINEPDQFTFNGNTRHTRLVIFKDGTKVDFAFYSTSDLEHILSLKRLPLDYNLGYKILLDKDNIASLLPKPTYEKYSSEKPTQQDFTRRVEVFFFEVYHVAKYLSRNDLWLAKFRDWQTKEQLLELIEWHAHSLRGWDCDTYELGKKMESWVEPKVWQSLSGVFGHFDRLDGWKALLSSIDLFREIAHEVASNLGYTYPEEVDHSISTFVNGLYKANK